MSGIGLKISIQVSGKNGDERPFDATKLVVGAGIGLQLAQF
jgi:hypothetical protein